MDFAEGKAENSEHSSGFSSSPDNLPVTKYAVVFLVEATGKLHRHMETLKSAYLSPILSYFRSINAANEIPGMDWMRHTVYGFVFYYSADAAKGQEVYCGVEPNDNEEAALQWFENIPVGHAPFIYAHQCCLLEAISAGIGYINRLIFRHFESTDHVEKHFIIVGQSAPYEELLFPGKLRPQTMQDAAQLISENNIHLSVINTRRSKILRDLFNSSRDINAFAETTANINEQHMVLLNNISIRPQEKFPEPPSVSAIENQFSPISALPVPDAPQSQRAPELLISPSADDKSNSLLQRILDSAPTKGHARSPIPVIDVLSPPRSASVQDIAPTTNLTSEAPHYSPGPMFNQDSPKTSSVNAPANRNSPLVLDVKYSIPLPVPNIPQLTTALASNKPPTVNVSRIADEVNSQYPRVANVPQMPRVGSNQNLAQFGSVPNQMPIQPNMTIPPSATRISGDRCIVWEGIVEWQNQSVVNQPIRTMHQVPCEIWVPVNDYIRAEKWPPKLTIQFLPANVNSTIQPFMDMPIKINFQFKQTNEAVKELHERLSKRNPITFGSILFSTNPHPSVVARLGSVETTVDLRVMVFLFNPSVHIFQGFIPRDQVGFVDALRQLTHSNNLSRQRVQMLQQQQQQQSQLPMPAQINQQRQMTGGVNQYGNYVQQTGSDAGFMQQSQPVQPNMGMGYSQVANGISQQVMNPHDQAMRFQQQQQQQTQIQQQTQQQQQTQIQHQQQQQQNIRFMFQQQQQHNPSQSMQMNQQMQNTQDPQLRALLQNSSPHLQALQFDK